MIERILLRGDGNSRIGLGHIMRLYTVSGYLKAIAPNWFCLVDSDDVAERFLTAEHVKQLTHFTNETEFLNHATAKDLVVLDGYTFSTDYIETLKNKGARVIVLDDLHNQYLPADVIINHTPGYERADFNIPASTRLFLGPDYCMIRPVFFKNRQRREINAIKRITLTLGMSDSGTLLSDTLHQVLTAFPDASIRVIPGKNMLPESLIQHEAVDCLANLSAQEMVELFDQTDLAIVPMSNLYMEAYSRNCLVAGGYFADNQEIVYNQVSAFGLIYGLGDFRTLTGQHVMQLASRIAETLPVSRENVLGNGWSEIIQTITAWKN